MRQLASFKHAYLHVDEGESFFFITEKRKQVSHKSDLKDCQEHLRHKKPQTISTIFGVLQMSHTRIFLHALKVMQRNASAKSNSKE